MTFIPLSPGSRLAWSKGLAGPTVSLSPSECGTAFDVMVNEHKNGQEWLNKHSQGILEWLKF